MHFRYPDHYEVEREKIREYAVAVQNDDAEFFDEKASADLGYGGLVARSRIKVPARRPCRFASVARCGGSVKRS